jgi:hypothetical protein
LKTVEPQGSVGSNPTPAVLLVRPEALPREAPTSQSLPRVPGHSCLLRRPRPYFATAHVPIVANTAMAIPDGMVVLFVPEPFTETKSGPHTALTATTTHIATIASDVHVSATRNWADHCRFSGASCVGWCETVDIPHLLPRLQAFMAPPVAHQRPHVSGRAELLSRMGAHGVENRAGLVGGGILNSGALTVRHTTISDNSAGLSGGGIVNQGGAVSLANVTFGGNTPNDCEAC